MTILLMSDSHRKIIPVQNLLSLYGNRLEVAIHLGDHADDLTRYEGEFPKLTMHTVAGNCDYPYFGDQDQLLKMSGKRILITHGHRYLVKETLDRIIYRAKELKVDACFFGHTHNPVIFDEDSIVFINPGSVGRPGYKEKPSYGLVQVPEEGPVKGKLMNI